MTAAPASEEQRVAVYVTGFGPFAHITENPSSTIARLLGEYLTTQTALVSMVSFSELETSSQATSRYCDELEKNVHDSLQRCPPEKILLLHVGVHSGEKNGVIRAEMCAFNELHASTPDVRGVMFNHDTICEDDGDINVYITSYFQQTEGRRKQLNALLRDLNDKSDEMGNTATVATSGPSQPTQISRWQLSEDGGRYLCNCCYYQSLRIQEKYPGQVASIFIHVCDPLQGNSSGLDCPSSPENVRPQTEDLEEVVIYNPSISQQLVEVQYLAVGLLKMMVSGDQGPANGGI